MNEEHQEYAVQEWLKEQELERNQPSGEGSFTQHTGYRGCSKCVTVGAHQWINVCACCGNQESRFENAEYLEFE
jgi:hypothetical protein